MHASVRFAVAILGVNLWLNGAAAQSWSAPRERPPLWQIIALDRSGESGWLYEPEDLAGDGTNRFEADEATTDLRSVYADADRDRLWLRAYVAASNVVATDLVTFFFIDSDARANTGGSAGATELWPQFTSDPSMGGYERAIGLRGDGRLIGAWRWDSTDRWVAESPSAPAIRIELARDQDPLRVAGNEHGYVQIAVEHALSGLDAACDGRIFVRTWLDADPPGRSFGDAVLGAAPCRPALNRFGDPIILHANGCSADRDCPAAGRCRQGVCLFEYACGADAECRTGERCMSSRCLKVVTGACAGDAECDGLVCDDGSCIGCSDSGQRMCGAGLVCSLRGVCVDPDAAKAGSGGAAGRGAAGAAAGAGEDDPYPPGKVRGGSFQCAAGRGRAAGTRAAWSIPALLALWLRRRARRAETKATPKAGRS